MMRSVAIIRTEAFGICDRPRRGEWRGPSAED